LVVTQNRKAIVHGKSKDECDIRKTLL
jgi:hypothetical protein